MTIVSATNIIPGTPVNFEGLDVEGDPMFHALVVAVEPQKTGLLLAVIPEGHSRAVEFTLAEPGEYSFPIS